MESFVRCGEAYRLEKVVRAPRAQAAWFAQGTAVHDVVERWEATGRIYGEAEALEWYQTAWDAEVAKMLEKEPDLSKWLTGGRTRADVDLANREERGRNQSLAYIDWALSHSNDWRILEYLPGEPAVEVPFEITLNGVTVIGYIDQIIEWQDGQVSVRDIKTGTKLPAGPRQLGLYGLAITDNLGIPVGYGDYYMSKNNDATKPYDLSRFTPERMGRWFKAMDNAVRRGEFIPNPGDGCRVCGVARFCDLLGAEAHLYPYETKEVA